MTIIGFYRILVEDFQSWFAGVKMFFPMFIAKTLAEFLIIYFWMFLYIHIYIYKMREFQYLLSR